MPDFYYAIYPTMRVGGGPPPYLYSAADQAVSARRADQDVKALVALDQQAAIKQGMWFPKELPRTLAEAEAYAGGLLDERG